MWLLQETKPQSSGSPLQTARVDRTTPGGPASGWVTGSHSAFLFLKDTRILTTHSKSLWGVISSCAQAPRSLDKGQILLFLAGNVRFQTPSNYSATLVDLDHSEVLNCVINLLPPNKLPFLAFLSLKHFILTQSFLYLGLPTSRAVSESSPWIWVSLITGCYTRTSGSEEWPVQVRSYKEPALGHMNGPQGQGQLLSRTFQTCHSGPWYPLISLFT